MKSLYLFALATLTSSLLIGCAAASLQSTGTKSSITNMKDYIITFTVGNSVKVDKTYRTTLRVKIRSWPHVSKGNENVALLAAHTGLETSLLGATSSNGGQATFSDYPPFATVINRWLAINRLGRLGRGQSLMWYTGQPPISMELFVATKYKILHFNQFHLVIVSMKTQGSHGPVILWEKVISPSR